MEGNLPGKLWPGKLWVVATPIGNLGDITQRAMSVLNEADFILCEDTRRTAILMSALRQSSSGESALSSTEALPPRGAFRLERCDAYVEPQKIRYWIDQLNQGKKIALVSDAGTPSISDPGASLVAAAHQALIQVIPIPGPSAVLALLSASGFQGTAFTFRGFFPRKRKDQEIELKLASSSSLSEIFVWFESPLRVVESFHVLSQMYPETQVVVGKELTKLHEKLFTGTSQEVSELIQQEIQVEGVLGEWSFAVYFPKEKKAMKEKYTSELDQNSDWVRALRCLLRAGVSVSESAQKVHEEFDIPKRLVYKTALSISDRT